MRKFRFIGIVFLAACLLSGCSMRTVDEMYRLPKRPDSYNNLQLAIDEAMPGLEFCAPLAGENQQTVQEADLDGDGKQEYLLFARGNTQMPLQILIFSKTEDGYVLADTIESNGYAFDLVEYVQMDSYEGVELIVGNQLSDQVLRSVSVYTFHDGQAERLMATGYTKFLSCDLDMDGLYELMVLRPGLSDTDNGIAELYGMKNGSVERSNEVSMSEPVSKLKRIIHGKLHGGVPAVFVGSSVEESAIITDVYTVVDGTFTNVSFSNESGTSVQTLRNYYVYAEDIDDDGEVELPNLVTMKPLASMTAGEAQYLIRWYSMDTDGAGIDKMYTYHNYLGGWYLQLENAWASRVSVAQEESGYAFYLWDSRYEHAEKIFTVFAFTGKDRDEQAVAQNRFVLYKGESTVYAAHMEAASGTVDLSMDDLVNGFHLIRRDWKTGET